MKIQSIAYLTFNKNVATKSKLKFKLIQSTQLIAKARSCWPLGLGFIGLCGNLFGAYNLLIYLKTINISPLVHHVPAKCHIDWIVFDISVGHIFTRTTALHLCLIQISKITKIKLFILNCDQFTKNAYTFWNFVMSHEYFISISTPLCESKKVNRYHLCSIGLYCNCIVTRGRVYDEILPEPEGNPEGGTREISWGLRQYNTAILNYLY